MCQPQDDTRAQFGGLSAEALKLKGLVRNTYLAGHSLSSEQARVWRAIEACRTLSMGGRHPQCNGCGREQWLFNSCRLPPLPAVPVRRA